MAGMMDNMKHNMSGAGGDMYDRFLELKSKEKSGELDDKGREELQQLRERMHRDKDQ